MEEEMRTLDDQLKIAQIKKLLIENDKAMDKLIPIDETVCICDISLFDFFKMKRKYCK